MGINYNFAKLLLHAKSLGTSFERTLTLGRQNLFVTARDLVPLFSKAGDPLSLGEAERLKRDGGGYCEPFFGRLGAKSVVSVDASSYESPTVVHDMNRPIPDSMRESFDAVFDGGTLEHIFDFPTAIRNCMELLSPGGHFIGATPANNFMGHGFYQFSPELFYQVFAEVNGFKVVGMYLCEDRSPYQWYEVAEPSKIRSRVLLINFRETHLLIVARRLDTRPIFAAAPQQSDYLCAWEEGSSCDSGLEDLDKSPSLVRRLLPDRIKTAIRPTYMLLKDLPMLLPGRRMPNRYYRKVPL